MQYQVLRYAIDVFGNDRIGNELRLPMANQFFNA
jgi:hypothetical protein